MSWREQTKDNPHFCIMAFDHMHVNTNGNVNLCCVADWQYPIRADAHAPTYKHYGQAMHTNK